jgi:DNA polymerase-3 subunit epsilon
MRQIVLDTETTGLEVNQGHRIIEIGCVELVNRRLTGKHYHQYINPQREIDSGAIEVHGITNEFLRDKPLFEKVAADFVEFVRGAQLIIHNAPFDVGFLDAELDRLGRGIGPIADLCEVVDSLVIARGKHPGQRNNLDALCQRYGVDNSTRDLHGALLDAEILADVYLAMTGGQTTFQLSADSEEAGSGRATRKAPRRVQREGVSLRVVEPSEDDLLAHERQLDAIAAASGGRVVWRE